jgi:hypothetical protein
VDAPKSGRIPTCPPRHFKIEILQRVAKSNPSRAGEHTSDTNNQFSIPAGLRSTADPIEGNPFPIDDDRHSVWQDATLEAEEQIFRFAALAPVGLRYMTPRDFEGWSLAAWLGKFDIWASRCVQVVWAEKDLRLFDRWLVAIRKACVEGLAESGSAAIPSLLQLEERLVGSMEWWRGRARSWLADDDALWTAPFQNTNWTDAHVTRSEPTAGTRGKPTDRRAMVDAYIEEVLQKTGKRITKTVIWKKAGYKRRTEFERWERQDPKRPNRTAHEKFMKILTEKPHLK